MKCDSCKHALKCPAKAEHGGAIRCSAFKPLTNEEWLKQCDTEQLAEWIADKINDTVYSMSIDAWAGDVDRDEYWQRKSEWVEWLKQPHTPKE